MWHCTVREDDVQRQCASKEWHGKQLMVAVLKLNKVMSGSSSANLEAVAPKLGDVPERFIGVRVQGEIITA